MSADGKFIPKVPKIQFYLIFWVIGTKRAGLAHTPQKGLVKPEIN